MIEVADHRPPTSDHRSPITDLRSTIDEPYEGTMSSLTTLPLAAATRWLGAGPGAHRASVHEPAAQRLADATSWRPYLRELRPGRARNVLDCAAAAPVTVSARWSSHQLDPTT
jgi:hypothetical protein